MITNTIRGPEFNTLLARCTQSETQAEFEDAKKRLAAFIDGWALGIGLKAVEEFKAVCTFQGQVACDEKYLDEVLNRAEFPDGYPQGTIKLDTFATKLEVPKDLTPMFTLDDPDLNRLLNDTAFLVQVGGNHDTGMMWLEGLEKIQERLPAYEPERDPVIYGQWRYRIHSMIQKKFGAATLKRFKGSEPVQDVFATGLHDALFLRFIEVEFNCTIPANVRQDMIAGTGEQLIQVFFDAADSFGCTGKIDVDPTPAETVKLLDRVGIESRLSKVALQFYSEANWRMFQGNQTTFIALLNPDEGSYDEWDDFETAIVEEFGIEFRYGPPVDEAEEFVHKTYVQVVDFIDERMKK